jgi:MFS transporter, AAHS family, 4-hydroxybenzoate transporter
VLVSIVNAQVAAVSQGKPSAQPALNILASTLYPTEIRATGVGLSLGVGRVGAIVGPVIAAQLVALNWSSQSLFLVAAVPALFSSVVVVGLAIATSRKFGAA